MSRRISVYFLRVLLAALSGAAVYFSYEPHGFWWAGILGISLLWASLLPWRAQALKGWQASVVAAAHALTLYLLLLPWIGELVGTMPYLALAVSLSLYALLLGWGASYLAKFSWGFAAFPCYYLAIELLRSSVPFGGFGWVRLAWGQINSPLIGLAQWGGTGLVTLTTVMIGVGVVGIFASPKKLLSGLMVVIPVVLGLPATALLDSPKHEVATAQVVAIQGNVPRLGLDFLGQRRAVLDNHIRVTYQAAKEKPDLVIWPENSSDINPFENPDALGAIQRVATSVKAPILVGTRTVDEVGERNTMQVFNADGTPGEHHHKKYLQPFGETMPLREFFRKITDLVDLAGDFKPGNGPGVVTMAGVKLGVATCYEVSFDNAFRTSIRNGAQILSTPTNNATFGFSDMTYQQLAMSRLRAIETDRAVVVAATSGVSAMVNPRGEVLSETQIFTPAYLSAALPLRDSVTPAVKYGFIIQALAVACGIAAVMAAMFIQFRSQKKSSN